MIRTIILIVAGYALYRSVRSWVMPDHPGKMDGATKDHIENVMVRDPVCQLYFPQREGIKWRDGAKTVYFCSRECLEKFKQTQLNQTNLNQNRDDG